MASVPRPLQEFEDAVEDASFDPVAPGHARPAPRWWGNHVAEIRWGAELLRLLVDPVFRGQGVPRGDGAPVLLIPGFLAGEASLQVMQSWLGRMGYDPAGSGIVANVDCSDRAVDRLERRLLAMHARSGRRVAIVGHSRGGHFAKALAHRHPGAVSSVVSMGAGLDEPFMISIPTKAAVAAFRTFYAHTSDRVARNGCFSDCCRCRFTTDYSAPFPPSIPLTSIYSKGDGVVRWEACIVPYARCVEVSGSHVGLAFNRRAYGVVAATLARETRGR